MKAQDGLNLLQVDSGKAHSLSAMSTIGAWVTISQGGEGGCYEYWQLVELVFFVCAE